MSRTQGTSLLLLAISAFLFFDDQASARPSDIPDVRLAYELALTHRILADELYLQGAHKSAEEHYLSAKEELEGITAVDVSRDQIELLRDEVDYRLQLLGAGASFWGGSFARTPLNPVYAFKRFEQLHTRFAEDVLNRPGFPGDHNP